MAINLMSAVFRTKIPTTQKFVFLALCDAANDQGECYPSVRTICEKTSLKDRAVRSAIKWLVDNGFMTIEERKARSNLFFIKQPSEWMEISENYGNTSTASDAVHPCIKCTPAPDAPLHDVQIPPASDADYPALNADPLHLTVTQPSVESLDIAQAKPSNGKQKKTAKQLSDYSLDWLTDAGVDKDVAEAYMRIRRNKKNPMNKFVVEKLVSQANKAGISLNEAIKFNATQGWIAFKADWYFKEKGENPVKPNNQKKSLFEVLAERKASRESNIVNAEIREVGNELIAC